MKSIAGPPSAPIVDSSPPKTTEKIPSMMNGNRKLKITASLSRKNALSSRTVREAPSDSVDRANPVCASALATV